MTVHKTRSRRIDISVPHGLGSVTDFSVGPKQATVDEPLDVMRRPSLHPHRRAPREL